MQSDIANWRIPNIDNLLNPVEYTGLDEESVATIRNTIAHDMEKTGHPVQFHTVRSMPNYALFELEEEKQDLSVSEFQQMIHASEISEHGWIIGTREHRGHDKPIIDVFIRTGEHRPLTLRQVLDRPRFRNALNHTSFIAGINLRQQVLIRDLATLPNLIFVGEQGTTQNFVRSILVTLLLHNTPTQLRMALIGNKSDQYREVIEAPHILGRSFVSARDGTRLLNGMSREILRRQSLLRREGYSSIEHYNQSTIDNNLPVLPLLILLLDAVFTSEWLGQMNSWMPYLNSIIAHGAATGIHVLMTTPDLVTHELLHPLYAAFSTKIMTRTIAEDYLDHIDGFHHSLTRFVDAFIVESDLWHAAEVASVTPLDAKAVVQYWQGIAEKKVQNSLFHGMSYSSNLTGTKPSSTPPTPPVPRPPSPNSLTKATRVLSSQEMELPNEAITKTSSVVTITESQEIPSTDAPLRNTILAADDEIRNPLGYQADPSKHAHIELETIRQAQALATYLGWLGKGPLIDVLGVSVEQANLIINILKARQILERTESNTPRTKPKR